MHTSPRFSLSAAPAAAQTITTIASNGAAGFSTNAPLLLGAHGNLYDVTKFGGNGQGTAFESTASGC